jgi:DNA-binding response OmpR family regulator
MEKPKPIKVLIAEDEDSFRMVLQRVILSNKEYEFEACASGDEVLELLKEKQFDVIILDHMMPGRSGLNILQWMLEQKLDTPVIMLTGAGSENIAVEAMKLGAYDYIRKETFEKEHLPHIINSAHERYLFRKERELRQSTPEVQGKSIDAFRLLSQCVQTTQDVLKSSFNATDREIESRAQELLAVLPREQAEALKLTMSRIRQQYDVLSLCTELFADLTNVMSDQSAFPSQSVKREEELKQILQRLEEYSQRRGPR